MKILSYKTAPSPVFLVLFLFLILSISCSEQPKPLGEHDAIRTYVEFADGKNRGMYNPDIEHSGFPDENFDATTAMVINWHRIPESDDVRNARLRYRKVHPSEGSWKTAEGESFEFWHREELINRVIVKNLEPNSIYQYLVTEGGESFHFRTMPSSLEERPVRLILTSDHQTPGWNDAAHNNAKMAALQQPDMFIVAGDFVNDEGHINPENAKRWADYLDNLYAANTGYFLIDVETDGKTFHNTVIPHVSVVGNHETGEEHHIRWPADLYAPQPSYPEFVAANWAELLFHWPYKSEGFYSEFRPNHPNINRTHVKEGFGHGGFGALHFSDYLLLIGMDNSQNWEGKPDEGLRDWEGNLITDKWPWFETQFSTVRQDLWLKELLEPDNGQRAGDLYTHIIPLWHRGLFGTVRQNMTFKNRKLLEYWLPLLYRNGVKLIKEGHDHVYTRTVPMSITTEQPPNSAIEKIYYEPETWKAADQFDQDYLDTFFAINTVVDLTTGDIIGWEYDGNFITPKEDGMIAVGHGGWAGSRREPGQRGGGNAGLWFVDDEKGGGSFGGDDSYHIHTVELTNQDIVVKAFHPSQLPNFEKGNTATPVYKFKWDLHKEHWCAYNYDQKTWVTYNRSLSSSDDLTSCQ